MNPVTVEDWQRLEASGGMVDLSRCVKLQLTGPDALRYLNGQVSNDVRRIADGATMPACICTHKGKLEAFVQIARSGDRFLITADEALRDFLPLRLEKYLIADDAVLSDVTEEYDLVHVFGPHPAPAGMVIAARRMGLPGSDVWMPRGAAHGLVFTEPALIEALRIDRGIPAWDSELAGGILPPEARLDESAIDYHKGCYTGQEVISRLRSVGQVNRRLDRFTVPQGTVEAGWPIVIRHEDGTFTNAGTITSAAWHPLRQEGIALGFLKRSSAGAPLLAMAPGGEPADAVEIRKPLDDAKP